jgi:hypothetical protein
MTDTQLWILLGTISFWALGIYWIVFRVRDSIVRELRNVQERQARIVGVLSQIRRELEPPG